MLSINTNSAYTYGCQTAAYRRQNIQKTFAENVNQQLTPPSVIHIGELGFGADNLGRQYALNYAEDSTDENPIVIAKGNDEYGQQFEERIYINDIDLNNASYLEMAALAAHTKTDSCVPTALSSGHHDYFQKENYVDDFNKCIADLYKTGSYDAALYETGILRKYMDYFKSIIKKLDYIAVGGIINMVNRVNTAVNNNIYAGRKPVSKYNQAQAFQQKEVLEIPDAVAVNKYANVQEIYEALKYNASCRGYEQGQDEIAEKEIQNDEPEISNDSSEKMTVWYQGVPLKEWALTDPKYTDSETGISWYIRDGKYPYMVGEDAEKFRKLCEESGEFALKKFAEMTGSIQKLDDNTVAYVGDNGIAVKSKDGKEMFVDTSGLSYDIVMDMFRNLPRNGDFFSNKYWSDNIQKAQARS